MAEHGNRCRRATDITGADHQHTHSQGSVRGFLNVLHSTIMGSFMYESQLLRHGSRRVYGR